MKEAQQTTLFSLDAYSLTKATHFINHKRPLSHSEAYEPLKIRGERLLRGSASHEA